MSLLVPAHLGSPAVCVLAYISSSYLKISYICSLFLLSHITHTQCKRHILQGQVPSSFFQLEKNYWILFFITVTYLVQEGLAVASIVQDVVV